MAESWVRDTHSLVIGYILWIFGFFGAHRFYYGRPISGTVYFFTLGLLFVGWIVDLFLIPSMDRSADLKFVEGPVDYGTEFPTSGPHNPVWADPGFYDEAIALENLVHSLEHGNIVIYFDEPGDAAMKVIRSWTDRFQGQWDGIVAMRVEGMGGRVVLTAWQHRLDLAKFDVRASFFVDAFRGRCPENRVR